MVDFGSQYNGAIFFPDDEIRKGWVPVHPITASWYTPNSTPDQYDEHACTMLPLRLAWAWTV
eukprot:11983720-Ditylum_brightwellii.AAC.1